jgi:hypothetical protein
VEAHAYNRRTQRLKQEDLEMEDSLGYITVPDLKKIFFNNPQNTYMR